ncbi:MAG: complex I NDUFA9 subunit family protein [Caulobacteraceae bacterium]
MQGLVTVFGGSGFVGRYAVRALARHGWRVRVAIRRPHLAPELKVMGDVGQIEIVQANVRDADSVRRALEGADACVNLVGVLFERGRQGFDALHATAPKTIAEIAASLYVRRLVQISAIGADANSTAKYAKTKAAGEAAVSAAFPQATILRPSVVFGAEDAFFNRFGAMAAMAPALPLIGGGKTRFQPVFSGDVGEAIAAALNDPATAGKTYELGGPAVYTFKELMQVVLRESMQKCALIAIPFPIASVMGKFGDIAAILPFAPPITSDQVENLRHDNVVGVSAQGLAALGVQPTPLDAVLPTYMWIYRKGGQFAQPEQGNAAA